MNPKVLIGALIGGALGAAIWAAIAYFLHVEIGWVAVGVGALCGGGAAIMGGSGAASGLTAASVALAAIAVGKVGAVYLVYSSLGSEENVAANIEWTDQDWQVANAEARAFGPISQNPAAWPEFMVENEYAEPPASQVTQEEIDYFEEVHAPILVQLDNRTLSRKGWETHQNRIISSYLGSTPIDSEMVTQGVIDGLHPLDALFAFLGVAAAWSVGKGRDE